MASVGNIVLSKGSLSVTIYPNEIPEEYANKLTVLPIPQTASNQASGPKDTKILDLLRLTHTLIIKGYLTASATKTAKEVKADLFNIIKGASTSGGTCSLTYDSNTINGYVEKVIIKEKAADDPEAGGTGKDFARYEVDLTFIEGVQAGGS